MASSQDIAKWVETYIDNVEWQSFEEVVVYAISKALPKTSVEFQTDLAEEHLNYVDEILRNKCSFTIQDGGVPCYEFDENESYIRKINGLHTEIAAKLRALDPYFFEVVCKRILEKLGALAENTKKTNDGGVDFYAFNMTSYSSTHPLPITAALSVIGQAKRYAVNNEVSESEIRKFIGGALQVTDELRKQGKLNVLSPIVYAFWTTSDLHRNAKDYSRKMGIWHLDGMALAEYVLKLELNEEIFDS